MKSFFVINENYFHKYDFSIFFQYCQYISSKNIDFLKKVFIFAFEQSFIISNDASNYENNFHFFAFFNLKMKIGVHFSVNKYLIFSI